ncbi:hypothetical protein DFJ73DRAFT_855757 [Zopfochytrium polystomum]|nr:hypothetical protein DFJ73DRAFT_855757 [Zopfochytrium polystomum]
MTKAMGRRTPSTDANHRSNGGGRDGTASPYVDEPPVHRHRRGKIPHRVPKPFVAIACTAIIVSAFFLLNSVPTLYDRVTRSITRINLSKLEVGWSAAQDVSDHDRMVERGLRRIATSESDVRWMDENEISNIVRSGANFMDITDEDLDPVSSEYVPKTFEFPTTTSFQSITAAITANMSTSSLEAWFSAFSTNFRDRSFRSSAGSDASDWLFTQVIDASMNRPPRMKSKTQVEVKSFRHAWPQASVIARLDGKVDVAEWEQPAVVLAAHIDSEGLDGSSTSGNPDGAAVLFESYHALVASGFSPKRPIEFHWYAAHAGGLLGSQKITSEYRRAGKPVLGVLAVDPRRSLAGLSTRDSPEKDAPLERFLKRVVEDYSDGPWVGVKCGFACSDHISWRKAGYASALLADSATSAKTDDNPSVNMLRFAKLAIASAVELSLF